VIEAFKIGAVHVKAIRYRLAIEHPLPTHLAHRQIQCGYQLLAAFAGA
jgi:hypothetical protein